MDIYLLNGDFEAVKIIDDFSSLIWRRKYNDVGDFELHGTHELFADMAAAKYVYRSDRTELGIIENYGLDYPTAFCKGRFLERLLYDSIIYPTAKYSNQTQEAIARGLMTTFAPSISLADANEPEIGEKITAQSTGGNLMEYLYELLGAVNASFSVTCDLPAKSPVFRVWQGVDRRASAVFSAEWDNLKTFNYEYSDKDYRNYAIVAGEGEGAERQFVEVDQSNGEPRRALFVDARDLQREEDEEDEVYKARLKQRGEKKLAEYGVVEKCEAEIDTESSLVYLKDFDLGDLCTVKESAHDITCEKRITVCEEVYENGVFSLSVTLGEGYLILPKYLERKLT